MDLERAQVHTITVGLNALELRIVFSTVLTTIITTVDLEVRQECLVKVRTSDFV